MPDLRLPFQILLIGLLTNVLWKDVVSSAPPVETAIAPAATVAPESDAAPPNAQVTPLAQVEAPLPVEEVAPAQAAPPTQAPSRPPPARIDVFAKALPAIVRIQAAGEMGSGTIISSDGLVLTNSHVVGRSREVEVQVQGQPVYGTVVKVAGGVESDIE